MICAQGPEAVLKDASSSRNKDGHFCEAGIGASFAKRGFLLSGESFLGEPHRALFLKYFRAAGVLCIRVTERATDEQRWTGSFYCRFTLASRWKVAGYLGERYIRRLYFFLLTFMCAYSSSDYIDHIHMSRSP